MKKLYKSTIKVVTSFLVMVALTTIPACNDNPDAYKVSSGVPTVSFVRIPDANTPDSLVTHAYMGTTIAIIGENLRSVKEVWFNDKQAILNTSFITSTSLILTVPNSIPEAITNKIYLVNESKDTIKYDFKVDVPNPLLSGMDCEYVQNGDTAIIKGNYFLPLSDSDFPEVTFSPNIKATKILSFNVNEIKLVVPDGAKEGPITVKSRYGSSRSKFYLRDTRGMILDWDNTNASGGWRAGVIDNKDGISGNYVKFSGKLDDTAGSGKTWNEDGFSFNLWGSSNGRPQGDLFSIPIEKAVLKFEINVVQPWSSCALQMIFTPWEMNNTNAYIGGNDKQEQLPGAIWNPWVNAEKGVFKTKGWITVSIPLTNFKYNRVGKELKVASAGNYGGLTFFVYSGGITATAACNPVMYIDNIRVISAE